ncbi:MAG: magnesium transporter [Christensenellales bacterium]|jgi:magnesium transporter
MNNNKYNYESSFSVQLSEELSSNIPKLLSFVKQNIQAKDFVVLKKALGLIQPADISELFDELTPGDMAIVFRLLPKSIAAETFIELNQGQQTYLLEILTDKELKEITDELFLDDFADLIEEMPSNVVKRVLRAADPVTRQKVNVLLGYPKDSAGSIMTIEYINLHHNLTVKECLDKIREQAMDKETIYTCYVTDAENKLIGVVTLKDLFTHPLTAVIGSIMDTNVISATTNADKEQVAGLLSRYGFLAIPITDMENHMVGIVTIDDAIDVLEEEVTEDISKMAAIIPQEKSYFETSVLSTSKSRAPWLFFLMVGATISSIILTVYEHSLSAINVILVASIPMLMNTGGNAGSQSSVTIIRGLVLQEVEYKDLLKVMWKETRIGMLLGAMLGVVCFAKLLLVDGLIMKSINVASGYGLLTALTVSLAIWSTVIIAKLTGGILPIIAKKFKLDPTVMASPLITTIIDILALLIFCFIAIQILG